MYKAEKFFKRKMRAKIMKKWRNLGMNSEVYQKYAHKLLLTGLKSMKKYFMRKKIKNFKKNKALRLFK